MKILYSIKTNRLKVHLTGRDYINWATDDDYFFIKKALSSFVSLTEDTEKADVIHTITWLSLLPLSIEVLKKKFVMSHIPHDVSHMLTNPKYLSIAPYVDLWIVPSQRAKHLVDLMKIPNLYIPYGVDHSTFNKICDPEQIETLRSEYNLPIDKYLIGSFQRDTEGIDLVTPKYIKGPDVFVQIVHLIYKQQRDIHIVLAGPRRFWIRKKLKELGVPYTFIGEDIDGGDDILQNTLKQSTINILYNVIDLYIISSRKEGGPKAILECAASKTKIISSNVGHAIDVLNKNQIYENVIDASNIALEDIANNTLDRFVTANYIKSKQHTLNDIVHYLKEVYQKIVNDIDFTKATYFKSFKELPTSKIHFFQLMNKKHLTIYFKFRKPPWGGGNQFLLALAKEFKSRGWRVSDNLESRARYVLFNSFHIDTSLIINFKNKRMIHRIDGPTVLIRGKDKELDDMIFKVNNELADISIFQSTWSLIKSLELKYTPVNPVIINNAADPSIFYSNGNLPKVLGEKMKIISTSWSNNPRKGGAIYKWLDNNLDWSRYEYTFVGNISEKLLNIRNLPPVDSETLGKLLKEHHIFLIASQNDPCSNALIEALSCGLPTIYYNGGGHPELANYGGLSFKRKEEIPGLLEQMVSNYEIFLELTVAPQLKDITNKYLECILCQ